MESALEALGCVAAAAAPAERLPRLFADALWTVEQLAHVLPPALCREVAALPRVVSSALRAAQWRHVAKLLRRGAGVRIDAALADAVARQHAGAWEALVRCIASALQRRVEARVCAATAAAAAAAVAPPPPAAEAAAAEAAPELALQVVPDDVLCEVFAQLPPDTLLQCRSVCRLWLHLASLEDVWRRSLALHVAARRVAPSPRGYVFYLRSQSGFVGSALCRAHVGALHGGQTVTACYPLRLAHGPGRPAPRRGAHAARAPREQQEQLLLVLSAGLDRCVALSALQCPPPAAYVPLKEFGARAPSIGGVALDVVASRTLLRTKREICLSCRDGRWCCFYATDTACVQLVDTRRCTRAAICEPAAAPPPLVRVPFVRRSNATEPVNVVYLASPLLFVATQSVVGVYLLTGVDDADDDAGSDNTGDEDCAGSGNPSGSRRIAAAAVAALAAGGAAGPSTVGAPAATLINELQVRGCSQLALHDGVLYVASAMSPFIETYDCESGCAQARIFTEVSHSISALCAATDRLYVGTSLNRLVCAEYGNRNGDDYRWRYRLSRASSASSSCEQTLFMSSHLKAGYWRSLLHLETWGSFLVVSNRCGSLAVCQRDACGFDEHAAGAAQPRLCFEHVAPATSMPVTQLAVLPGPYPLVVSFAAQSNRVQLTLFR